MITRIHGIVLSVVRHNDRSDIVTLYTAERGRVAFVSSAGTGKAGRLRKARLAPLALIESDVNFKGNRDLQTLAAVATPNPWRELYFDPRKAPVVFFLSEFLNRGLRTSEPDAVTWRFLISAISTLDSSSGNLANYHIAFLIRYLHIAGIAPDTGGMQPGDLFDMRTAEFTPVHPGHRDILLPGEAALVPLMMRMNFGNMARFRFNIAQRRRLVAALLHYYSIHLPISVDLKSLDVLSELFS